MKNILLYEGFLKKKILNLSEFQISVDNYFLQTYEETKNWLDIFKIKNYTINDDLTVDVSGDVYLNYKSLTKISIKFNSINGTFYCNDNQLTSLKGCPSTINGSFSCFNNQLTSLEFCPTTINGSFSCFNNQLTSLEFCPSNVKDQFYCSNNKLEDINDLDIEILLKTNLNNIKVKQEVYDKYFEYWITKDSRVFNKLKNVISKDKFKEYFNANNFDLI